MEGHKTMPDTVFIDTWGWLAIGHQRDPFHKEVVEYYQKLQEDKIRIYTSDYILDETITLLFRREKYEDAVKFMGGIFQSSERGYIIIDKINAPRFSSAWELRKSFKDKPLISFTDITTMVIMQERGIKYILTKDDHFKHVGMGFQIVP
jgi:predicted nucleic acid-binding protein